jgi:hypothetical protein
MIIRFLRPKLFYPSINLGERIPITFWERYAAILILISCIGKWKTCMAEEEIYPFRRRWFSSCESHAGWSQWRVRIQEYLTLTIRSIMVLLAYGIGRGMSQACTTSTFNRSRLFDHGPLFLHVKNLIFMHWKIRAARSTELSPIERSKRWKP